MKVVIINGEHWLCLEDQAFGWYGAKITKEAYESLKECQIDDDNIKPMQAFKKEIEAQ